MKTKFIYESVGNVLRPKTRDQIINDISKLSKKDLNKKFLEASEKGYIVVKLLLEAGADVDAKDNSGWIALMYASNNGHVDVVRLLLGVGANVEAKDDDCGTALMIASCTDYVDVVKLLLEAGANVNAKDDYGWTALTLASDNNNIKIVKLLKKYGAKE